MNYWLMKSEPSVYSIDNLKRDKQTCWEGVRNYQARNFMRDQMKKGDLVLFYHSSTQPPGVAGIAKVVREGYADPFQFDRNSPYYDPTSKKDEPRWITVDVAFVRKLKSLIPLDELRADPKLKDMLLLRKGSRLSVQPLTKTQFERIVAKTA